VGVGADDALDVGVAAALGVFEFPAVASDGVVADGAEVVLEAVAVAAAGAGVAVAGSALAAGVVVLDTFACVGVSEEATSLVAGVAEFPPAAMFAGVPPHVGSAGSAALALFTDLVVAFGAAGCAGVAWPCCPLVGVEPSDFPDFAGAAGF